MLAVPDSAICLPCASDHDGWCGVNHVLQPTVVGEAALAAFAPGRIVQWHVVLPLVLVTVPVCLAIDRRPAQPLLGAVDGLAVVPFASRVELVL